MFSPAKLTRPAFRPPLLLVLAISLLLGGCASGAGDSFTLQADLPANFKFTGDAYYVPAPGETCSVPERIGGRRPDRKFFESDYEAAAHRVEFQVPLRDKVRGCPLVLRSMRVELKGKWSDRKWGSDWVDISSDSASLSFRDALPAGYPGMPISGLREIEGQCHWMFRTFGRERGLRKLVRCQAVDDGQVQKWKPGAALQRDQLPGKTVRLVIGMSEEEESYYDGYWLKTPAGWRPCTGRWGTKNEELCTEPPQFTDFKLPDGRTCTVYPTCTEQESRP
ncbi:hypothetical protein [Pseudomonas citronellolis]|uniref:hypothetical protein n=1 Tax=Pseudomonas citronellolis TaxID=53408 RepID=UPI000718A929|nr:hypothetical protein [Pseudomonas citronellolis]KRV80416.1 hypothetical protein AO742_09585 [Pseudomonas citronellolis]KRW72264.1 hypothetical protein AO738_18710 [Pseudomonas citronellolis]WRT84188.1 hypothetical protein VK748_07180 [Pseudomonas citronellolis]